MLEEVAVKGVEILFVQGLLEVETCNVDSLTVERHVLSYLLEKRFGFYYKLGNQPIFYFYFLLFILLINSYLHTSCYFGRFIFVITFYLIQNIAKNTHQLKVPLQTNLCRLF